MDKALAVFIPLGLYSAYASVLYGLFVRKPGKAASTVFKIHVLAALTAAAIYSPIIICRS